MSTRSSLHIVLIKHASIARSMVSVAIALGVLASCASDPAPLEPDQDSDRLISEDAARAAAAQPLENTYPNLKEVPGRPTLGYSAAQRQQIQQGLIADLAYAERISQLVRGSDGADLPPPPKPTPIVPSTARPAAVPAATQRPPSKVVLVERRDTSGNLSSFLDDVVGVEPEVDPTRQPATVSVPPGSTTAAGTSESEIIAPQAQTDDPAEALDPNAEPGFFTSLAGVFGGVVDQTATVTPDAAGLSTASAGETSSALPIGTDWHFPLAGQVVEPTEEALAVMLAELSGAGALQDRRLAVEAHATDPALSERRARSLVTRLEAIGVPATLIDVRPAASTGGNGVDVVVVPIGG